MRHRIKKIPTLSKLNHKFNHHLLHSDKSAYFYKGKVKVGSLGKHILYSPSIPLLGSVALLLVLGLSIGCVGGASGISDSNGIAYAEGTPAEECNAGNTVLSLDMSGDMELSTSVDNDISNGNISYLSKDFTVTACRTAGYKVYVQANSSKLQNQQAPDALFGVGENKAVTDFIDNTWGYAVDEASKDNTAMVYNTMPEPSTSRTESYAENTSTGAAGKALKITFAAKFGKDKVAGHYTSDVLMSVVANAKDTVIYSITYSGNGNTSGTPPVAQTAEGGETYTFTVTGVGDLMKNGYALAGWAETSNATTAQYQPGGTITLKKDAPTKTLYAVWDKIIFNGITTMQEMTTDTCKAATVGDTKQLIDTRVNNDGKTRTYWVSKLADENCWMTQNLDFDLKSGTNLTPSDSDVTSNWDPKQTTIAQGNLSLSVWPDLYNNSSADPNITRSYDPGEKYCIVAGKCDLNVSQNSGHDAQGNYYTWVAATAGTGSGITDGKSAAGSICPKGWKLPPSNGFAELLRVYIGTETANSDAKLLIDPLYFVRADAIFSGSSELTGGNSIYYHTAAGSNGYPKNSIVFAAYNGGTAVYGTSTQARYRGYSIRCIAR